MTARTQRSFETLYHEHVSDVYRYALAVTGQASDAEDVTQTTFMNAYRAYVRGERPRKPQNWLLKIAHNVCRQRARLASYRVREVELEEDVTEALVPADDVPTAADIRRALSFLPFQQRAVLIMRELEGRTHAEIAEVMGLTTPATEMLAFRARRALREHLAGSLTCTQAATALDRQQDATLDAESAGLLRAHLRECSDCRQLARRLRAQQSAWKSLAVVPLPTSLHTFGGGAGAVAGGGAAVGGAGLGAGVAIKLAAATVAAVTVGGTAYFVKQQVPPLHRHHATTPPAAPHAGRPNPKPPRTPVASGHQTQQAPHAGTATPTTISTPASVEPPATQQPIHPLHPVQPVHPVHPKPAHPAHPAHPTHPTTPQTNHGVRTRAHGTPTQAHANETAHGKGRPLIP